MGVPKLWLFGPVKGTVWLGDRQATFRLSSSDSVNYIMGGDGSGQKAPVVLLPLLLLLIQLTMSVATLLGSGIGKSPPPQLVVPAMHSFSMSFCCAHPEVKPLFTS